MKIFKTWITAAVLLGGLLLTACTNDDNPLAARPVALRSSYEK